MLESCEDECLLCDLFSTFARAPSKDVRAKSMPPNIEAGGCGGKVVLSPLWELVIFLYIYSCAVSILLASCVKQRAVPSHSWGNFSLVVCQNVADTTCCLMQVLFSLFCFSLHDCSRNLTATTYPHASKVDGRHQKPLGLQATVW